MEAGVGRTEEGGGGVAGSGRGVQPRSTPLLALPKELALCSRYDRDLDGISWGTIDEVYIQAESSFVLPSPY